MRRFLLCSVAVAALLSTGQMANAQGASTAPSTADRPASDTPAEKKPAPKAQAESKEQPTAAKPSGEVEHKSPSKAESETKEPDSRAKSAQEKNPAPKTSTESKEPAAKSSTSTQQEKSAPAKASSETKDAPSHAGTTPSSKTPSAPVKDNAETKPSTSPNTPSSAQPAAGNAGTTSPTAPKTGETNSGQPTSQQSAATSSQNASSVPPEKAAKISDVISREKVQSVENVNFSVSVGVNVPSTVAIHPLPASIVEIVPEYRGYDYVVVHDEIVIVEPRTRKIVTVVHRGGSNVSSARSSARISLTPERRRMIKQKLVRSSSPRPAQTTSRLVVGAEVPQTYEIREFPNEVVEESPELREYEYVLDDDNVIVVDRRDRRVIEIID
jgi:Protein of unknown function (DUF1236).